MFAVVFLGTLLFGLVHSVFASFTFKDRVRNWLGERGYYGFFRLFYNILAVVTFAPVLAVVAIKPGKDVYNLGESWQLPMAVIRAVGMTGLVLSLTQIDFLRFIGVRQVWAYFRGNRLPLPEEPLQTGGVFALVRHPLYLFSLMLIWSSTRITASALGFNVAATIYFVVGSIFEERKLAAEFGQQYRDYRARVPWLIPGLPLRLRSKSSIH
jgi:protein-S-isoprenylcysteine O-methyltransferase Ste14